MSQDSQRPSNSPGADDATRAAADRAPSPLAELRDDSASSDPSTPALLERGESLGDYSICRVLGSGAFATVYLARDMRLERLVALKITSTPSPEGRTLAQLDHPHIVPIYREEDVAGRGLLSMKPIIGGTLGDWLQERIADRQRWRGGQLLEWLDQHSRSLREGESLGAADQLTADRDALRAERYLPAMAAMLQKLATALAHAHAQDVMHCDIKPANILLDRNGHAWLSDFNVSSRRPREWNDAPPEMQGGTLPYMSPEQLKSLLPDCDNTRIDPRSDIYSLGIVGYEMFCRAHPWPPIGATSQDSTPHASRQLLAQRLTPPDLASLEAESPSLASILKQALQPNPAARYASADELAEDLERWHENRPLKYAADRDLFDRTSRLVRRRPLVTLLGGLLLGLLLSGFGVLRTFARQRQAVRWMDQSQTLLATDPTAAARLLGRAEAEVEASGYWSPSWQGVQQKRITELRRGLARVKLQLFRQLADLRRQQLDRTTLADPLSLFGPLEDAAWQAAPEAADDAAELLLIRAFHRRGRATHGKSPRELTARQLLSRMPQPWRSQPEVQAVCRALLAGRSAPDTSKWRREFPVYLAGVLAALRHEYDEAIGLLERAIALRPTRQRPRFWARFHLAVCCARRQRLPEAIAHYGACLVLRPEFAWTYHNLGQAYLQSQEYGLAEKQMRRALQHDPQLVSAWMHLGIALHQQRRPNEALTAYDRAVRAAVRQQRESATLYVNRAIARHLAGDPQGAAADFRRALAIDPKHRPAQTGLERLKQE